MADSNVDLVALAPSDNLHYELGFSPFADERACLLLVSEHGLAFVVPALNADQAAQAAPGLAAHTWKTRGSVRRDSERARNLRRRRFPARCGRSGDARRHLPHAPVVRAGRGAHERGRADGTAAGGQVGRRDRPAPRVRAHGGPRDAERARRMPRRRDRARGGRSRQGRVQRGRRGPVTFTIAASGPNGAFPHHHTGQRVLEVGDAVVIDIGASRAGYASDLTRMAFVGEPSDRYREVHAIVEAAVQAAMAAARPGATPDQIDGAARGVIQERGYGENFVHRTGHGLGLSVHEPPWIMSGADECAAEGHGLQHRAGDLSSGRVRRPAGRDRLPDRRRLRTRSACFRATSTRPADSAADADRSCKE